MASKKNTSAKRKKNTSKKKKAQTPAKRFIFTVLKMMFIACVIIAVIAAGLIGGTLYGYIRSAEPISDSDLMINTGLTSFIYDSKGEVITKLTGKENKDREQVTFNQIPDYLKDAVVAIEDERFYEHIGVDLRRMASALLSAVTSLGNPKHGASTITQQVVRSITGNTERTLSRKVQEQWNAIQLEKRYDKWRILELYMNVIFMGENCYGVQSASKRYLGKNVWDLSLAECALLAGITNSPNNLYNLRSEEGRKRAKQRQENILAKMLELGNIDQQQHDLAVKEKLNYVEHDQTAWIPATQTYFVDQVINDVTRALVNEKGISEEEARRRIYNNGYRIYTTQDSGVQEAMDIVFKDDKYFAVVNSEAKKNNERPQAAMVIVDPYTGEIRAMYGGSGEKKGNLILNRATQIHRQPGSSFKPIAVYGPAVDLHIITPATIIDNAPVYMDPQNPSRLYPQNFDRKYQGLTSIRNGIKSSVNVIAAKVWKEHLGRDNSVQYLNKVGINRENEIFDTSVAVAMGGLKTGVNAMDMASAYTPFVNRGLYYEPTTYTKVTDSADNVLLETKPGYHPVYSEEAAFLMTSMLQEVTSSQGGTAYPRGIIKNSKGQVIPTAGKTGTTSNNFDKWFVGYSPYYTAAIWYGYDDQKELQGDERSQALKIWHDVMEKAHSNLEPRNFEMPVGLIKKNICIYSGKIATELCLHDPRGSAVREEYFIKGTEPKDHELCRVHVSASVCKESKDIWGRNLLANASCPLESILTKVFIQRPEPYAPKNAGEPYPEDYKLYELPAGEYCTIHSGYYFE